MKKHIFILVTSSIIAVSCQKEVSETTVKQVVTEAPQFSQSFTNPFESVGTLHNEAMDYVVTYLGSGFKTESPANQLAALESFANSKSEPFDLTLTHAEDVYNSIPTSDQDDHIADRIAVYQSSAGLSTQAGDDIQAMFDELFSMESLGFSGYSTVASNISSIEESVYNDSDYNSSERDIVLQVGAMLRHSLAYWVNVAETPTHPRHGDDEITGPIGVAFADAKAFLEDLIFNDTNGRPKDVARYASNMYANTHG